MAEYEYRDADGDTLRVETYTAQEADFVSLASYIAGDSTSVDVPAVMVPAVAADIHRAMMRAAGHPEPIILDGPGEGEAVNGQVDADAGHIEIDIHGCYAPGPARRLAAFIAAEADTAERKPDRDEVRRVAQAMADAETGEVAQKARDGRDGWYEALARSLLRTHTVTPRGES